MNLWQLIKDILLTGLGMTLIGSQVFAVHRSDVLLVTGLALTVPSVKGHATALLSGRTGGRSSPPSPPPGPPASTPPSGADGEGA